MTRKIDDLSSEVMKHFDDEEDQKTKDQKAEKEWHQNAQSHLSEGELLDWDDTFMSGRWQD